MPPQGQPLPAEGLAAIGFLALMMLSGCLASWVWALHRLSKGLPLLEPTPGTPRPVPWGGLSIVGVVAIYVALQALVGIGYGVAGRFGLLERPGGGTLPPHVIVAIMAAVNLLLLAVVPAFLRRTSGASLSDFLPDGPAGIGRGLKRGLVAFLVLAPLVYGAFYLATRYFPPSDHPISEVMTGRRTTAMAALVMISAVVAAPIAEELLFRGVLLGWLTTVTCGLQKSKPRWGFGDETWESSRVDESPWLDREAFPNEPNGRGPSSDAVGPWPEFEPFPNEPKPAGPRPTIGGLPLAAWGANALVSVGFAAMHAEQWPAPIPLFVLSMGLGWLSQRTGGLAASIGLHMAFNGFATAILLIGSFGGVPLEEKAATPAPALSAAAGS